MNLAQTIKKATAGIPAIARSLASSTVDTTRMIQTRDTAGRTVNTPINPLLSSEWMISEMAEGRRERIWGSKSAATAEALLPIGTDVEPNDVVDVIDGDYLGNVYEVEQTQSNPLGNLMLVALVETGQKPFEAGS